MKKIELFEPWFFIFFGIFHLHRIWGIIDRKAYTEFWIGVMNEKGVFCTCRLLKGTSKLVDVSRRL